MLNDDKQNSPAIEEQEEDIMEFLKRMQSEFGGNEPQDDENTLGTMSADEHHNKAVGYARRGNMKEAVKVCLAGLELYPKDVDLMADTIKYSAEQGDFDAANHWFDQLSNRVSRRFWNWRAYTFCFDYLLMDAEKNEEVCRGLVQDYCKYLPFEEKSRMAESELEAALGNHERSLSVLKEAISVLPNAPQCSLRLADMQLERGMYEDVVHTARYGLSASAETQPSINIPYMYYVMALAEDALLHRKYAESNEVPQDEVMRIRNSYAKMLNKFPELRRHKDNIAMRIKMLDMLKPDDTTDIQVM